MDAAAVATPITVTVTAPRPSHFWAGHGLSFHDVLDAINPLQHIPVISTIYRKLTGDQPGNVAEIVGDGLFGGLIGLASGVVDVAVKEATGKDIGDTILAALHIGSSDDQAPRTKTETTPESTSQAADAAPAKPSAATLSTAVPAAQPPTDGTEAAPASAPQPLVNGLKPLGAKAAFIPIDVSDNGIRAMRASVAAHSPKPVPLDLPPGAQLSAAPVAVDFAQKFREGLDKYDAMIARRTGNPGASIDQIH
jgi:hypothetical protein